MTGAHTPGPWSFDGPSHSIIVWGPEPEQRVCFMTSDGPAQPNACLISAAPTLLAEVEAALIFLRTAPLESGVCCCGDAVDSHNMGSGHSPVDDLQYHAANLAERLEAAIAKARGETA